MANQVTGLAAMPGPRSNDAPYFSNDNVNHFADFMHEYEALARAKGLTDDEKVEAIFSYVPPNLRKFWKSVNGYTQTDWAVFRAALEDMYPDTSAATRIAKKALQDLIYKTSHSCTGDEDDVLDYYHLFLELSNPLTEACQLLDEAHDAKFFKGLHRDDREILASRLFTMKPNHPQDKPYELNDIFKAARGYFSNAQFYRPKQRQSRDQSRDDSDNDFDCDSDSDSNYDSRDSRRDRDSHRRNNRGGSDRRHNNSRHRRGRDDFDEDSYDEEPRCDHKRNHSRDRDHRVHDPYRSTNSHKHNSRRGREPHDRDHRRSHDHRDHSRDSSPQRGSSASATQTKIVRFKKHKEDQEMEDLLSKMHGLNIRDSTYTILHAQLHCRWPSIANDYPKPEAVSAAPQPATYSYQAPPAPPNSNASQQWSRTPAPTTSTSRYEDPESFFRSRQRSEGCAFCNQKGHRIRECNLAEEYVRSGRASQAATPWRFPSRPGPRPRHR